MKDIIKKYEQFILENNSLITETEIREYLKEECDLMFDDLFKKVSDKFPLDNMDLAEDNESFKKIKEIKSELIETTIDIVIENIKDFNSTWENPDEKIESGDTVVHNETGKEYVVSRFGSNNNFYDNEQHIFIDLSDVSKKIEKGDEETE